MARALENLAQDALGKFIVFNDENGSHEKSSRSSQGQKSPLRIASSTMRRASRNRAKSEALERIIR
jgi:hypothetical protein